MKEEVPVYFVDAFDLGEKWDLTRNTAHSIV